MKTSQLFREFESQLLADEVITPAVYPQLPAYWWTLYIESLFVAVMILFFLLPVQPPMWIFASCSMLLSVALFIPLVRLLRRLPRKWLHFSIWVSCGLLILELLLPLTLAATLLLTRV